MRPVKFRAWDKENGIMIFSHEEQDWYTFGFEKGVLKCWRTWEEPDSYEEPAHIDSEELDTPLMQFTGLLDRNGKEIYEGDVVLLWDEPDRSQVIADLQLAHTLMSECILSDSCRIIGNIYENPELLEGKK